MGAKSKICLKNIESRNLIPTEWFLYIFHEKKLLSVRIDPATIGSEPILPEMRHFRKSRLETDIAKNCEIKFQWGVLGVF